MKIFKWIIGIVAVLLLLFFFVGMPYLREQTKKHSPEKTAQYDAAGITLTVNYSSPSKKGREIFGGLVPYDQVWRTGANEPTTFTTTHDIEVGGKPLPAGTYSLWTVPGREIWTIIFNDKVPDWGVTLLSGGKQTTRDPDNDVIQVAVPTLSLPTPVEDFTIEFDIISSQVHMRLAWDRTEVLTRINP